jgi:hypothetical protein
MFGCGLFNGIAHFFQHPSIYDGHHTASMTIIIFDADRTKKEAL